MSVSRIPMTQENYEKQQDELGKLQALLREVTEKVAEARAEGDLKENAEYHAQRERQGQVQAKIDLVQDRLARAQIIDPSELPDGTVVFGSRVTIKDVETGEEEIYELVGPGDEDYENNRILTSSPRGQALLGKKIGDIAEVQAPRRTFRYEVLDIVQSFGAD